jgi:tRNA G18 (ribose-2'-O)-methylase SpoU
MINLDASKSKWTIITCSNKGDMNLNELKINKDQNVILVFGDEKGLSEQLMKTTKNNVSFRPQGNDNLVGKFPYTLVDSMNSSVACSLLLNHIKH